MLHRVGVISDTHVPRFKGIPDSVWQQFANVEHILHAGDLSVLSVLSELETIAPVTAVQGNVETEEVLLKLPIKRELRIGFCKIGMVHILGDSKTHASVARREFPDARVVVFGHSHIPYNQEHESQLVFNPGSANDRRRQPACSIGMLTIDDETQSVHGEIIVI